MRPLMELSASLDTYRPNSAALFRSISTGSKSELILNDGKMMNVHRRRRFSHNFTHHLENEKNNYDLNISAIYNTKNDWGAQFRAPTTLQNFKGDNPNGLTKKQELMVRSAIKYWVERHKHVVRLVAAIGDTYGLALLLHMLTSTIMLTLLAYQATKIEGINVYGLCVIGYLSYALAQVFHFCIFGNRLIEEVREPAVICGSD
jgi:odorant receptor